MKKRPSVFLFICLFLLIALPDQGRSENTHLLGLGIGTIGILDGHKAVYGSLEYRSPVELYFLRPWTSLEFAENFYYVTTGVLADFELSNHLLLTPSFGIGFYSQDNGVELGHPVEFRSTIELSYRFRHSGRLAISFGHISNGGMDDTNPGSELLRICYFLPLGAD